MDKTVVIALVTLIGTLIVGFLSTFVAEHYRRFRDSTALAGAIAGELGSYKDAWPILNESITNLSNLASASAGELIKIPKMEKPTDRVFDSCVDKLGLLGPELAEDVAYVYNNINAFRVAMQVASEAESSLQQAALLKNSLLGRVNTILL